MDALWCWAGDTLKVLPGKLLKCDNIYGPAEDIHQVHGCRNILGWLLAPEEEKWSRNKSLGFARIRFRERTPSTQGNKAQRVAVVPAGVTMTTEDGDPESASRTFEDMFGPEIAAAPVSKEELGRSSWTLLHTIAAQFPEKPSRQQQKDVKELMAIFSRIYPCKQCADHFKEVLRLWPVQAGSGAELTQWMCRVHNVVNRSLGKPHFPCESVGTRWGALHCDDGACDVHNHLQ